jgi:hypothetical protein
MFVHEPITARHNRYGFGDSRIADSVSQTAMRRFLTTTRADLTRAFTQGQGNPQPGWDAGGWAAGAFGSMAEAFANAFGTASDSSSPGMFEPARQSVEAIPSWVYWAGGGAVVLLVGAVAYKAKRGRR